ncbi:hypothetical protein [Flavobacterium gelatinilyticum]|uniref:hypothetical protein n=1 Tax=Flavobacterium gelatinilyticum TaxID=3003260 RepID=UPI00247FD77D|nr:hypothetical protein [Flavobacterium gelatinilyticum]
MGYLIIKYIPQANNYFQIMAEDRVDINFTSTIVNYTEKKRAFDITIKDNSMELLHI